MKPIFVLFLLVVAIVAAMVSKPWPGRPIAEVRQEQEAAPEAIEISPNTYRISMEIESENDISVADILWFQEAAEVALEQNIPWFNVLEQKISEDAMIIEGVIVLEPDPMKAEFDANEILSLHLSDEVSEKKD